MLAYIHFGRLLIISWATYWAIIKFGWATFWAIFSQTHPVTLKANQGGRNLGAKSRSAIDTIGGEPLIVKPF
jgi:hypothetical protein